MIKVFDNGGKTADRYTVIFNDKDVYCMSENANMPNGVNMYMGEIGIDINIDYIKLDEKINLSDLPRGVLLAIIYKLMFDNSITER